MKVLFGFLCLLLKFAGQCICDLCVQKDLQSCLKPSLDYLRNVSTIYGPHSGFLETTISYFFMLNYQDGNNYHTGSFGTVMLRLDDIFNHHSKLEAGCRIFTTAENCLLAKKEWCDQEIRGVVEGIENAFNFLCHKKYMKVFKDNQACILGNAMESARFTCNRKLIQTLNEIGEHGGTGKGSGKWQQNEFSNDDLDTKLKTMKVVCSSVKDALTCFRDSSKSICGETSANWEYKIRHDLVQLLLNDVCGEQQDYDYLEPLTLDECFTCANGEKCVPSSMTCDGQKHCADGSDEAHTLCGHHWGTLDTTLIIAGLIIVTAITILCIIKYRESIEYTLKHRLQWRSREMQVFMNETEEESSSLSPSQNRSFQYDKLTPSDDSEVYNV